MLFTDYPDWDHSVDMKEGRRFLDILNFIHHFKGKLNEELATEIVHHFIAAGTWFIEYFKDYDIYSDPVST